MDQLHTANKVCGGCCAISLNTVDTESSVSPIHCSIRIRQLNGKTTIIIVTIAYDNIVYDLYV